MHPSQEAQGREQFSAKLGGALFACRALATSVEVFLHDPGSFGERYLGLQAIAAAVFLLIFPTFLPQEDPGMLLGFLCFYLLFCVAIRGRAAKRRRQGGAQPHSFYNGRPSILRLARRMSERSAKATAEPLLTCGAGTLLMEVDRPLGSYLVLAGLGLMVSVHASLALKRRRALDMHDTLMEQRDVADRFRRLRGE